MIHATQTHLCELRAPLSLTKLPHRLAAGDREGDLFAITVLRGGQPVDLTGTAISAYFLRESTGETLILQGTASGSTAQVRLPAACYAVDGPFTLTVKATLGEVRHTLFLAEGQVLRTSTDALLDPEEVIPDVTDLLELLPTLQGAAAEAVTATSSARAAAQDASAAADRAEEAAEQATSAAENLAPWQRASATVTMGPAESPAACVVTTAGEGARFDFALPRGETGLTPELRLGPVTTGLPGTLASATLTGPKESPLLSLTLPRGETGSIEHFPYASNPPPMAAETGSVGTVDRVAREDHVHPLPPLPRLGDPCQGRDLTQLHAAEIKGYANVWQWLKARIAAANFRDIHVKDYIPITFTNGVQLTAQIAGIDLYYDYGDKRVGHHIDFITKELWPEMVQVNRVGFNNGLSSESPHPWLSSQAHAYLNSLQAEVIYSVSPRETQTVDYREDGIYAMMPEALKAVIIPKRMYLPTRYSATGLLTADASDAWQSVGPLWLPTEVEVFGMVHWGGTEYASCGSLQYPLFADCAARHKNIAKTSNDAAWWTMTARHSNSVNFVLVHRLGYAYTLITSTGAGVPVCFRVGA